MSVVKYGIQKVLAVNRISSHFLDPGGLPFHEYHFVKELIALLHTDVLSDNVLYIIIWIEDFHLDVEQSRFTLDPHETAGLFIVERAVNIDRHVGTLLRQDGDSGNVGVCIECNDP